MPLSKIEVCYSHPPTTVQALMDAVIQAQREVLQIPEHDRQIRYIEHRPEHFWIPPNKSQKYTLIEICMFYGRSLETKKRLYQTFDTASYFHKYLQLIFSSLLLQQLLLLPHLPFLNLFVF